MMPQVPSDAPAVLTPKGLLRPERAILHNKPFLLLWHFDPVRSGHALDEATMAGLKKTAQRLELLLRPHNSSAFRPMAWPQPEVVLFTLGPGAAATTTALARKLTQAEQVWYVEPLEAIEYRRC
jgi:hypothetical protein